MRERECLRERKRKVYIYKYEIQFKWLYEKVK